MCTIIILDYCSKFNITSIREREEVMEAAIVDGCSNQSYGGGLNHCLSMIIYHYLILLCLGKGLDKGLYASILLKALLLARAS